MSYYFLEITCKKKKTNFTRKIKNKQKKIIIKNIANVMYLYVKLIINENQLLNLYF